MTERLFDSDGLYTEAGKTFSEEVRPRIDALVTDQNMEELDPRDMELVLQSEFWFSITAKRTHRLIAKRIAEQEKEET